MGDAGGTRDPLERLRATAERIIPSRRLAHALAFEAGVFWYALFSWRSKPEAGNAVRTLYTHHEKSGYGAVVAVVALAIAVEITPVHALVSSWSSSAAWIITALSLYGAVWLIGDYRALRLRPTLTDADGLHIRFGLRWTLSVPRDRIKAIQDRGRSAARDPADLRLTLPGSSRLAVQLNDPVVATGPYGMRRDVRVFELGLDDPDGLRADLAVSEP